MLQFGGQVPHPLPWRQSLDALQVREVDCWESMVCDVNVRQRRSGQVPQNLVDRRSSREVAPLRRSVGAGSAPGVMYRDQWSGIAVERCQSNNAFPQLRDTEVGHVQLQTGVVVMFLRNVLTAGRQLSDARALSGPASRRPSVRPPAPANKSILLSTCTE